MILLRIEKSALTAINSHKRSRPRVSRSPMSRRPSRTHGGLPNWTTTVNASMRNPSRHTTPAKLQAGAKPASPLPNHFRNNHCPNLLRPPRTTSSIHPLLLHPPIHRQFWALPLVPHHNRVRALGFSRPVMPARTHLSTRRTEVDLRLLPLLPIWLATPLLTATSRIPMYHSQGHSPSYASLHRRPRLRWRRLRCRLLGGLLLHRTRSRSPFCHPRDRRTRGRLFTTLRTTGRPVSTAFWARLLRLPRSTRWIR